jgi:DNA-binding NtrC family response regulator
MQSNISAFTSRGSILLSTGYRVLVGEDDTEFRHLLAMVLEGDGYNVQEAADGTQIIEWLAYWSDLGSLDAACNLIISDIRMPGFSGLDVLTSLHCLDSQIPVIVITAFGDEETQRMASCLGAVAFLSKPIDMDDLRTVVLNVLTNSQRCRRRAANS